MQTLGIRRLDLGNDGGRVEFNHDTRVDPTTIVSLVQTHSATYRLDGATTLRVSRQAPRLRVARAFAAALLERLEGGARRRPRGQRLMAARPGGLRRSSPRSRASRHAAGCCSRPRCTRRHLPRKDARGSPEPPLVLHRSGGVPATPGGGPRQRRGAGAGAPAPATRAAEFPTSDAGVGAVRLDPVTRACLTFPSLDLSSLPPELRQLQLPSAPPRRDQAGRPPPPSRRAPTTAGVEPPRHRPELAPDPLLDFLRAAGRASKTPAGEQLSLAAHGYLHPQRRGPRPRPPRRLSGAAARPLAAARAATGRAPGAVDSARAPLRRP